MIRWGAGITVAGVVAGGAFAAVTSAGGGSPGSPAAAPAAAAGGQSNLNAQASANQTELSTLLSAASTSALPPATDRDRLGRLRGIGGYYGSLTFGTKAGVRTVAFERGTIQSVTGSDVVVRAPDGTTMTWLVVSDTVVRDHGKASTKVLSDGQLVFVGGPVVSGARDARLIVVRTGGSAKAPSSPSSPASPAPASSSPSGTPMS